MTQVELADKMLVSYQAVSNWERETACLISANWLIFHISWA